MHHARSASNYLLKELHLLRRSRSPRSACDTRRSGARLQLRYFPAPRDACRTRKPGLAMSRRDSSRITPVLHREYRDAAKAADWVRCRILAEQMRGLDETTSSPPKPRMPSASRRRCLATETQDDQAL